MRTGAELKQACEEAAVSKKTQRAQREAAKAPPEPVDTFFRVEDGNWRRLGSFAVHVKDTESKVGEK